MEREISNYDEKGRKSDIDNSQSVITFEAVSPSLSRTIKTASIFLSLWSFPLIIIAATIGVENIFFLKVYSSAKQLS